jgi:hypothetical protein
MDPKRNSEQMTKILMIEEHRIPPYTKKRKPKKTRRLRAMQTPADPEKSNHCTKLET